MGSLETVAGRIKSVGGRVLQGALRKAGTRCMFCGRAMQGVAPDSCCPECTHALAPRSSGFCPLCGEPYAAQGEAVSLCGPCRTVPRPWSGFGFYAVYQGALREAITAFKYGTDFGYLRLLQYCLLQAWQRHLAGSGCDILVPVPLHYRRLGRRGFNQSVEICRPLAPRLKAVLAPKALCRLRDTVSQSGLDRRQRRRNMSWVVSGDPAMVRSRRILLVDDVYTTGVTAEVCTRALLRAGARRVDLLVLARVAEA